MMIQLQIQEMLRLLKGVYTSLTVAIEHIERFGMPFNYDVECFESLNKISRWAIQHSNTSDDSQSALDYWIKRDTNNHFLSGGYCIESRGTDINNVIIMLTVLTLH